MLIRQVCQVDGESCAAPNELQVKLSFLLGKAGLEDAPEHAHNSVVFGAPRVLCDRLELVNIDRLLTAGSDFDLVPLHEAERRQVSKHGLNTAPQLLNLLLVLVLASLEYEVNELLRILNS